MATKASGQVDLIDLTDGYSVHLTNDNYTFLGTTTSVNGTQTTTCKIMALCGGDQVPCTVGAITTSTGISAVSDGKTPEPTITITATAALTTPGFFTIPVVIGDITINKVFSYAIAFKGASGANGSNGTSVTVSSTAVTYQSSTSGTVTPTGAWVSTLPATVAGQYLWTKTVVNYSDGKSTTAYSVSRNAVNGANGSNGISVTVSSTAVTYQSSASGTVTPTGTWATTIPATVAGQYLWTRTIVTYSDNKSTTSYSVSRNAVDGADAINLVVTSSGGFIFKNTAIASTLTARVYKGGVEVTGAALTALGAIKWYKDGGTTAVATGETLNVSAGTVLNKATYTAQLEG